MLIFLVAYRTARPREANEVCHFRLGVTIGRAVHCDTDTDAWFLIPLQPHHNDHTPYDTNVSRKPIRLHSQDELQIAQDVLQSYGGAGVARSLYYHRTGEVEN